MADKGFTITDLLDPLGVNKRLGCLINFSYSLIVMLNSCPSLYRKTKQRQVVCLYIVGLSYVVSDVDLIQVPILL